ncbi:MAG: hypothetical protein WDN46_17680 [Methylocella sp.]
MLQRTGSAEEAAGDEHFAREEELIELILPAPAPYHWMIFCKFEIINYYLTKHGEASWTELLALQALDAIKGDMLRMGQVRERHIGKEFTARWAPLSEPTT